MLAAMRSQRAIAASLAGLVLAVTAVAPLLSCETDATATAVVQPRHHHEAAATRAHTDHGAPARNRAGDRADDVCCRTSLYNVIFQSVSPADVLRADSSALIPTGLVRTATCFTVATTDARGGRWATGPPSARGASSPLFPARPRFLALASFLL